MILDLPQTFRFEISQKDFAEVKDGQLHLYGEIPYKKVIHNITFALKGNDICHYCGKAVQRKDMTLDHMYAQFVGGSTITNNLVPCCAKCNVNKSNLSEKQYQTYLTLKKKEEGEAYRQLVYQEQLAIKKGGGCELPEEWITVEDVDSFIIRVNLDEEYRGHKRSKIKSYYKEYGTIPKPIIVDKNNFLLDGYIALMFAKEQGLKKIPVIRLDNVIAHF